MDIKKHLITHEVLDVKGIGELDTRYLNVTGDTATGSIIIQPTVDTLTALVVNDTDSNNVLTVDTINNRVGTNEIRALSASGLKLYEDGGKGIFVKDSTGYVGIGTAAPTSKLSVLGRIDQPASLNPTLGKTYRATQSFTIAGASPVDATIKVLSFLAVPFL